MMSLLHKLNSRCFPSSKFPPALLAINGHCSHSPIFPRVTFIYLTPSRQLYGEGLYTSVALSSPVLTVQDLLLSFHSYSGLPWWAVISLSTLGIRSFIVLPLAIHQNQVISRLANLNEELKNMVPELNKEVNIAAKLYGWNENSARKVYRKNMKDYYNKFIIRDNCHPLKIVLLGVFQVPAWICFSFALRNITMLSLENPTLSQQMKAEGVLWFTDLTVPDLFYIPILLTAFNLLIIEITALKQIGKGSKFQTMLTNFMRVVVLMVGGAATLNPSSVTFYWLCSSVFGAVQNFIFLAPRFRRLCRIPKTTNESSTPYRDIASNFKKRFLK